MGATYFGGVCVNLLRHPGVGPGAGDLRRGPAPARRDGRGAHARRAGARARVRQALRLQLDGERAVHRRRHGRRARAPRGVPAALPARRRRGRRQRHELLQLPERRVGRTVVRPAHRRAARRVGLRGVRHHRLHLRPARPGAVGPRRPRHRDAVRAAARRRAAGCPGRARVTRAELDVPATRVVATLLRFAGLVTSRRRRRRCSPRRSTARWPAAPPEESIVLLTNRDELLPVDRRHVHRIAVLGRLAAVPNLGDGGSSAVHPPHVVTPLDGIRDAFPTPRSCTPTPTRRSRRTPTWWSWWSGTRRPTRASTSRARTRSSSRCSRRSTTHAWPGGTGAAAPAGAAGSWSSRPTRRRWHRAATAARCGWPTTTRG